MNSEAKSAAMINKRLSCPQCRLTIECCLKSTMKSQSKVTAAAAPPTFPETDLTIVKHGRVEVSVPLCHSSKKKKVAFIIFILNYPVIYFPQDHVLRFSVAHAVLCPQHQKRKNQRAKTCSQTYRTSVTAKGRPAQENRL